MRKIFLTNCFWLLLNVLHAATTGELNEDIIVQLKEGKIRGHILKSENGNDYYAFQEIPYAAPPVGENRLQLPKKVQPWNGILDTTKNTRICYQMISKYSNLEIKEDCLYMNIYTPVKPGSNSRGLPVLLWIHGGGYTAESSTFEYSSPKYIMDQGVVVVTFNYRLGPFGFTTTDDGVIPANIGLKDQRLALEWVSENIHLFAGDSNKITIVGESAGSFSVGLHILGQSNEEKALFRAAIMQSGSPTEGIIQKNPRENAFSCGRVLNGNFSSNETSDLLKVLQEASAENFFQACSAASGTVIEKQGPFSYPPLQSFMDGNFKKIPILMGFNSEEWLYSALDTNLTERAEIDDNPDELITDLIHMSPENRTIAGQLLKKVYTNTSFQEDIGAFCRWFSDRMMITPICKQAELISSEVPVYLYQFSYYGELGQGPTEIIPGAGRVPHAADIHYMWEDVSNSDLSKFPEEDVLTLHRFVRMWTNFIKYLNPTPEKDPLLDNFLWPTTNSNNLLYFNFNDTLEVREYPRQYKNVKAILDNYMIPPYDYY
ncbi:juvenile hormone esterase isoform X1 [Leptinotarsa decemlineata]|uniref:juvenile hormone esterase isoform X1 n=1 Tax=Leptinotarsa decemlineata TaxID=7539 RepID=UPI003D3067D6